MRGERMEPDIPDPIRSYEGDVPVPWPLLSRAYSVLSAVDDLFDAEAEVAERRARQPEGTTDRAGLWLYVHELVEELVSVLGDWEDAQRKVR